MPLTPEQEAIAAPYIDAAVELIEMLKSDRGLAITFARHHGLIPGDYVEPRSATTEWLKNVLAASPECPHCGAPSFRARLAAPRVEHRRSGPWPVSRHSRA